MNSDNTLYVGAYLVVDQFYEDTMTSRQCDKGHRHHEGKFCKECGTKFEDREFPRTQRMTWEHAAAEFNLNIDAFINVWRGDRPHIWIGNLTSDNRADYSSRTYELTRDSIEKAVDDFRNTYARVLSRLQKEGVSYSMRYGVVIYDGFA